MILLIMKTFIEANEQETLEFPWGTILIFFIVIYLAYRNKNKLNKKQNDDKF